MANLIIRQSAMADILVVSVSHLERRTRANLACVPFHYHSAMALAQSLATKATYSRCAFHRACGCNRYMVIHAAALLLCLSKHVL
jgi:hypothetical protein